MTTGSIQSEALTLSKHKETYMVFLTLTNNDGAALQQGHEVYLNGDLQVAHRTAGDQFPIGNVDVAGANEELVTIATVFRQTMAAYNASGGAFTAGDFVRPNGTINANGRPEYVAATDENLTTPALGDWASAVVLQGGADTENVLLGILRTPVKNTVV